ncbi:MAG TPA: hypothetical protein PKM25_10965 [Candidatus Ozemobacteraceae bacterium]|nr:hypothetical protein [Candidatus Ozemobacteraceae bacterium]
MGMIPIFSLLTETRRVTTSSIHELQATSMASSMIVGLQRVPWASLKPLLGQELADASFPAALTTEKLGVPPCYSGLTRLTEVSVVNQPVMPDERLKNPWGRVIEIKVTVSLISKEANMKNLKKVLVVKGYRVLEDAEI